MTCIPPGRSVTGNLLRAVSRSKINSWMQLPVAGRQAIHIASFELAENHEKVPDTTISSQIQCFVCLQ